MTLYALLAGALEAVWDWGGKHSRGSDVMRKNVREGGGQTKNLHHHQSYTLHAGPAECFSKWSINDQERRKLAWGPGREPQQGGSRGSGVLGI